MANSWDRIQPKGKQRGETARNYLAFRAYLAQGPGRSIRGAIGGQRDGKVGAAVLRRWEAWSARFQWVKRAAAYDEHLARLERAEHERFRLEIARGRLKAEALLITLAERAMVLFDAALLRYLDYPALDTEELSADGTITRRRGLRPREIARFHQELRDTVAAAVQDTDAVAEEAQPTGPARRVVLPLAGTPFICERKRRKR